MALSVSEAHAVNRLLDVLLRPRPNGFGRRPSDVEILDAAEFLALKAHRRLSAGWTPGQVREAGLRDPST